MTQSRSSSTAFAGAAAASASLLILGGLAPIHAQRPAPAIAQVERFVARYDSAWNRRDTVTVARLLAPRYQYFTSRGGLSSRAETLAFLNDPAYVLDRAERSELAVSLSGAVAVVSSRWRGSGRYRGEAFTDDQRCGQTWVGANGAWRLLSEHCAQIVPEATGSGVSGSAAAQVTGIGGLFFRSHDPEQLGRWYRDRLGITLTPESYGEEPWRQEAGPTVFAPFPEKTEYFGAPDQEWMINFRVKDLDAIAAQLTAAGVTVTIDPKEYPNGRFASLKDPEGNPIQLWEPREPQPVGP